MKSLAVPPQRQQGQKGHEKETQMKRHEEKPKNLRKEKNMKTTIVGWTKKKAFNGVIEGKQINSPEKVVFQLLQEVDNPDCHGKMVDTLKFRPKMQSDSTEILRTSISFSAVM